MCIEALGPLASALVDGEPEVLAGALSDVHHPTDPEKVIKLSAWGKVDRALSS